MKFSPEAEGWRRKRNERGLLRRYGGLAQLGERLPCKQEVAGSIPTISTKRIPSHGPVAQLARAYD